MKWIKTNEYKTDGQANRLVVKTKEGNLALYTHTGSVISQICMTDQYEFYLDESLPDDEKDKEIERLKGLIEKAFGFGYSSGHVLGEKGNISLLCKQFKTDNSL